MNFDPAQSVDDIHYASVEFRQFAAPDELFHNNIQRFQLHKQEQEVIYSSVKLQSNTATWWENMAITRNLA